MVDFPDQKGKMCDWVTVQAVDGALRTLKELSKSHPVYIATNAADSSETDIKLAFERGGYLFTYRVTFAKRTLV